MSQAFGHGFAYLESPQEKFVNEFRFRTKDDSFHRILSTASVPRDTDAMPSCKPGSHLDTPRASGLPILWWTSVSWLLAAGAKFDGTRNSGFRNTRMLSSHTR